MNASTTSLDIREVFSEDCGTYTVVAKNMGGEARTTCHLSLVEAPAAYVTPARVAAKRPVKPLFVQPLESRTVLQGNHIRLECVITGYPEPEVILTSLSSVKSKSNQNRFYQRVIKNDYIVSLVLYTRTQKDILEKLKERKSLSSNRIREGGSGSSSSSSTP